MLSTQQTGEFIARHRLPPGFARLIETHYEPLARWLLPQAKGALTLGINGAQGTGKSTLAEYLRISLDNAGRRLAVLSIDDFYLTAREREQLAARVHPLLRIRGVPGTHDTALLGETLDRLVALRPGDTVSLPRFDKAADDRAEGRDWPAIEGPVDLIVLEGWCVGSRPLPDDELAEPLNDLERERDADGRWRRYVNERLAGSYATVFDRLDRLIFLAAPGFEAVYRWRLEQEEKLAAGAAPGAPGVMSADEIADFIRHYERLTRANLRALPEVADVVLELDENHDCVRTHFRNL